MPAKSPQLLRKEKLFRVAADYGDKQCMVRYKTIAGRKQLLGRKRGAAQSRLTALDREVKELAEKRLQNNELPDAMIARRYRDDVEEILRVKSKPKDRNEQLDEIIAVADHLKKEAMIEKTDLLYRIKINEQRDCNHELREIKEDEDEHFKQMNNVLDLLELRLTQRETSGVVTAEIKDLDRGRKRARSRSRSRSLSPQHYSVGSQQRRLRRVNSIGDVVVREEPEAMEELDRMVDIFIKDGILDDREKKRIVGFCAYKDITRRHMLEYLATKGITEEMFDADGDSDIRREHFEKVQAEAASEVSADSLSFDD